MARMRGVAEAVWRERLAKFPASGLSVGAFCEREGVSASSFHAWKRRLGLGRAHAPSRQKANAPPVGEPLFVPFPLSGQALARDAELRITFPGGVVVSVPLGVDEAVLVRILEVAVRASEEGRPC